MNGNEVRQKTNDHHCQICPFIALSLGAWVYFIYLSTFRDLKPLAQTSYLLRLSNLPLSTFRFYGVKISHRPNSVHIFMRRLTFLIWLYFSHLEQFILNLTHFYYRPKVEKPIWNILIRIYEINEGQSTGQTSANVRRRDF